MMSSLPSFRLMHPTSASGAVVMLCENPASRFIAGGTDLLPNIRRGLLAPPVLIDLGSVDELREFSVDANRARFGAGVTLASLAADPRVLQSLPALAQAALAVAGPTHRTVATLGGNLCLDTRCQYYNQSEAWREGNEYCMKCAGDTCRAAPKSARCFAAFSGDVAPALLALDATVELLGPQGLRRLPIRDFYCDDGMVSLALAADEMLVAVEVPISDGWSSAYDKVRVRGAIDFPLAGIAIALRRDGEVLSGLRIACTGVSSRPELADSLDEVIGKRLDDAAFTMIEKCVRRCVQPMETTVVSVPYRRRVTPVLARRLLQRLWESE
jgi:4-hydroxybenzoyl-CoA reductase subunit beta